MLFGAGNAFANLHLRGRYRLFRLLIAALVIPAQVAMSPLFLLCKELGLVNSFAGVLAPNLATIFGIFLVRQSALSIPDEMLEAARVDGADEWRIFVRVVLSGLSPILITLAPIAFPTSWIDYPRPLLLLNDAGHQPLQGPLVGLARVHCQANEVMMTGSEGS